MTSYATNVLKGWTVVAVDDDPDSLELVRYLLELYGATVYSAPNGQHGLDLIRAHHPDFVISDLSMPLMSGWDMVAALRADAAFAELPVFALTAHAMTGDRERAVAAGFFNYLAKPIAPHTFVEDVISALLQHAAFRTRLHGEP